MGNVKLVWITPDAEKQIMYCARVSSDNQNSNNTKLLEYCMKHGHWSIYEMANMCIEINTSRAISAQILRHRSFSFQEYSQRYSKTQNFEIYNARRQDTKNRQNSIDDMSLKERNWFLRTQERLQNEAQTAYNDALDMGIAKEQARFLLPMSSSTKLYMNGTIRSWIHFFNVRCDKSTQLEHREIAENIKEIFKKELPIIGGLI